MCGVPPNIPPRVYERCNEPKRLRVLSAAVGANCFVSNVTEEEGVADAHYTVEKLEHEWLVLVNGAPQLCCKSRKMAERITRQATLSQTRKQQTLLCTNGSDVIIEMTEAMT